MSTISASTTSTTGFKVTSDTTGTLVFQTGASPTTAMTLGSDQSVTFAGAQTYTGAATFTTGISVQGLTVGRGAGAVSTNTAVGGFTPLGANTTGSLNSAYGAYALYANTTGAENTSGGYASMISNTTGSYNVAWGRDALRSNTTASYNTAVGYQAGYSNTVSSYNTFVGAKAGYNTTGSSNAFFGDESGYSTTTGIQNTFIGQAAGYYISTGSKNTIIGQYTGNQGGLDIRTASNYIVLSDGDGRPNIVSVYSGSIYTTHFGDTPSSWGVNGVIVPTYNGANQPAFRTYDTNSSSNTYTTWSLYRNASQVGSVTTTLSATAYNTSSDYRLKENVQPMTGALSKVAQLKPCTYTWKVDGASGQGFIAHELAEVVPDCVTGEKDAIDEDGNPVYQGIDTSFLVATLTAAIQELNAKFEAYKAAHP